MPIVTTRLNAAGTLLALLIGWSDPANGGTKLIATGGVMQVEGAAGGGLTPWALIGGLGTEDEIGASAFATTVNVDDTASIREASPLASTIA